MGTHVIGLASNKNHDWLKEHGVIPVDHNGDAENNIKAALDDKKADAFIDTFGKGYVEIAVKLGISPERINTIIDFEAVEKYKVKSEGSAKAASADVLSKLAAMINNGKLEIPIAKTYSLEEVKEAYKELEQRHTHGKIVLIP